MKKYDLSTECYRVLYSTNNIDLFRLCLFIPNTGLGNVKETNAMQEFIKTDAVRSNLGFHIGKWCVNFHVIPCSYL